MPGNCAGQPLSCIVCDNAVRQLSGGGQRLNHADYSRGADMFPLPKAVELRAGSTQIATLCRVHARMQSGRGGVGGPDPAAAAKLFGLPVGARMAEEGSREQQRVEEQQWTMGRSTFSTLATLSLSPCSVHGGGGLGSRPLLLFPGTT
jgi:hypothetical protein